MHKPGALALTLTLLALAQAVGAEEFDKAAARGTTLKPSGDPIFFWEEDRWAQATAAPVAAVVAQPAATAPSTPAATLAAAPASTLPPPTPAAAAGDEARCSQESVLGRLFSASCLGPLVHGMSTPHRLPEHRLSDRDRPGGGPGGNDGDSGGGAGAGPGGAEAGSSGGGASADAGGAEAGSGSGGGHAEAGPGGASASSGS